MSTKILLWLVWFVFIAYTLLLTPLDQPGNITLLEKLIKLQWSEVNPIIAVIFSLMGVWPMIYASFMFIDGAYKPPNSIRGTAPHDRTQNISAWPSFLTSNGAGVIGLLPYLILRQPNHEIPDNKDIGIRILDSRWYGISLSLVLESLPFFTNKFNQAKKINRPLA